MRSTSMLLALVWFGKGGLNYRNGGAKCGHNHKRTHLSVAIPSFVLRFFSIPPLLILSCYVSSRCRCIVGMGLLQRERLDSGVGGGGEWTSMYST